MTEKQSQRQQFLQCLRRLQTASNDSEKFASLLMIPQCAGASALSREDRMKIAEAAGQDFFARLLHTSTVPEGCSPLVWKTVAVSILNVLTEDWSVCQQLMKTVAPFLKAIIMEKKELHDSGEKLQLQKDTYRLLYRAACVDGETLIGCQYPQLLLHLLASDDPLLPLGLLILLQAVCGSAMWGTTTPSLTDFLDFLMVKTLASDDQDLFKYCQLLEYVLHFATEADLKSSRISTHVEPVLKKLSLLLRSRLGVDQRQGLLMLVSQFAVTLGVDCLLGHDKFLNLVVQLTCVEIRMAVENVTLSELQNSSKLLGHCYSVLELVLEYLCRNDTDQNLPLDADTFCQIHDAVLQATNGIFHLLLQFDMKLLDTEKLYPVVLASVRMLTTIACLAPSEVKQNFIKALPFFLTFCELELKHIHTDETGASNQFCEKEQATPSMRQGDCAACGQSGWTEKGASDEFPSTVTGQDVAGLKSLSFEQANKEHLWQNEEDIVPSTVTGQDVAGLKSLSFQQANKEHLWQNEEDIVPNSLQAVVNLTRNEAPSFSPGLCSAQAVKWIGAAVQVMCEDDEVYRMFMDMCTNNSLRHILLKPQKQD